MSAFLLSSLLGLAILQLYKRAVSQSSIKIVSVAARNGYEPYSVHKYLPCCLVNRSFELCPQLGGCRPFPCSESSIKGIRILVAEQVRHLCDIDIRPVQILARQFLPRRQKQLPESRSVIDDPPLQGPIAQPKLTRHSRDVGTGPGKQAFKNPFHLLADRTLRALLFEGFDELGVQHFKQLGVVGKERSVEIGHVQDEDIPARFEFDRAFEISFVDPGPFCFALELHPFRIHRMPRTTATEFNE